MRTFPGILLLTFVAIGAGATHAAKPGGGGGTPPPGSACVGQDGVFPAMAYSRGVFSKSGSYTKTQIFVANSLGTCEVMVWDTGDYDGSPILPSFHFNFTGAGSATGTIAWTQTRDNGETSRNRRPVVKVVQFQVSGNAVVGLPLTSVAAYRAPSTAGFLDVELSPDGTRLAFSTADRGGLQAGPETEAVRICDVATCASTLETAFQASWSNAVDQVGGTFELTIGHGESSQERIYFVYRPNAAWSDGDLVAIDKDGAAWNAPVVIVSRDSYIGDADTFLREPSALSRIGEPDRLLIWSRASLNAGVPRVDVYDGGTNELTLAVGTGYRPTWTSLPFIDATPPNMLVSEGATTQTAALVEIDPDGPTQAALPGVRGYGVDSAE